MKNLCQLQFVSVMLCPTTWWWISFCAEEYPEGWIRAGEVCTVWELIWYWIDKSKEGRVFSIYTLMLGEKTKWNPSKPSGPPYDWLWTMRLDPVINALQCSASPSQHPLPQTAIVMIWWIIPFKVLDDVHIFCLCLSVFQSQNPRHYHVVSVLNQKLSYTASAFECGRAEVHVCVIWSYLLDHFWLHHKAGITIHILFQQSHRRYV